MSERQFRQEVNDWSKGCQTDFSPDKIPSNASPRALNAAWVQYGMPAKRKGCSIITQTGETGKGQILALGYYPHAGWNWTISANGRWSKLSAGAFVSIVGGTPAPFTVGTPPSTALANNLLFAVNGTDAWKTDGTVITKFGIATPAVPTVTDAAAAGNETGTYYGAVTAYNSVTGHESSLSASASVVVAASKVKIAWSFPADAQVTHVRVHIFKTGLTDRFLRLGSTNVTPNAGAYDATYGGYSSATGFVTVNVTDADINNLTVQSPTTSENNPPPAGTKYIFYHNGRMFATEGTTLYFSKIGDPESFDPEDNEVVNPNDGQSIIAFATLNETHLVILKEKASYQLVGPNDPNTWEVQDLDPSIGITSFRTLIQAEGVLWWEAPQGLMRMEAGKLPMRADSPNIGNLIEDLNPLYTSLSVAAYDELRQRVLFGVPEDGETTNTALLPYNGKVGVWEGKWDPMNIGSLGTLKDTTTGEFYVGIGSYHGRVFRLWDLPYVDGVRVDDGLGNNFTLSGNPTSAGASSLTDTHATFDTSGDGLKDIPVVMVSSDGQVERNIILSNTSTVLTLAAAWTVQPDTTWTYYIGSPNFEFDTKYFAPAVWPPNTDGSPFNTRSFKQFMLKGISDTGSVTFDIYVILDHSVSSFAKHMQVMVTGTGALFDIDEWDVGIFGSDKAGVDMKSIGVRGRVCGFRIVNRTPASGAILLSVGVMGTEHSTNT